MMNLPPSMRPPDRTDGLMRELEYKTDLGRELLGFIDRTREPFEYEGGADEDPDQGQDLAPSMSTLPFRKDEDDA